MFLATPMRDEAIKNDSPVSFEDTKVNFVCQGQTAIFFENSFVIRFIMEAVAAGIEQGSPQSERAWGAWRGGDFRSPRKPAAPVPFAEDYL